MTDDQERGDYRPTPPPVTPGDPDYNHHLDASTMFGHHMYYDRDGNPISMRQAMELGFPGPDRNDPSGGYARIASDNLDEGNIWVSTVWLGLDHGWGRGKPQIFETMVFVALTEEQLAERAAKWDRQFGTSPWDGGQCWRWSTEDEARAGHRIVVDSLRVSVEQFYELNGHE